ncbi:MAG: DNA-binding response regulator [Chloroflexi bacterium RBG_13_46_14]|nr:MAG: DNA-binding response regulator [Chloroflexi bacterium RBG_13_46_14]
MKMLIIEDAPEIVEAVSLIIEMRWPESKIISTALGEKGIDLVETESPDLIILDIGLPDISGFDVLKRIRLFSDVPILILTVNSDETSIVRGLEGGADDYIVKPFKQLELLARVQGALRRFKSYGDKPLSFGKLLFDPQSMRVVYGENKMQISRTEGIILGQLIRNAGAVVTYSDISEVIWGIDFTGASDSIKVHIRHLREKLELDPSKPKLILNKPGVGYFLNKS